MITYEKNSQQPIPAAAVKIIGLGGAGANMLGRIALDGLDGAELIALNTDVRTLNACVTREKIQLGANLTKGLGTGGDPELGHRAVLEAEDAIRESVKGKRIVFLCTGLGGGTGSGAAPIVTRVAREEGAFVVVFATMPFVFEGKRRIEQAETALNELAVLSNALVTFDNNRMGELVLAKQGIHEAFNAADAMICESIKAVIRLVVRPGLINVGLDELMSALRANRSRCLFGSGIASGKDRAAKALRNSLGSPLLDQGSLLKEARSVLVHLSGGEDLTLFEIELLMQELQKYVPENAQILFGAAVDPAMADSLSITLISSLPEDALTSAPRDSLSRSPLLETTALEPSQGFTSPPKPTKQPATIPPPLPPQQEFPAAEAAPVVHEDTAAEKLAPAPEKPTAPPEKAPVSSLAKHAPSQDLSLFEDQPSNGKSGQNERPFGEAFPLMDEPPEPDESPAEPAIAEFISEPADIAEDAREEIPTPEMPDEPAPTAERPLGDSHVSLAPEMGASATDELAEDNVPWETSAAEPAETDARKLKLRLKSAVPQNELSLDSPPRGRFQGETPNVFDGEDLDLPPFLRKKS